MSEPISKSVNCIQERQFYISHDPTGTEDEIWLILHGYGQLAEFFLRKFRPFFHPSRLFVAPEGINRSYQEGFSGRVGANWMTKHHRESDIVNGMNYLDAVVDEVVKTFEDVPVINVLGFSQGAATASRWVVQSPLEIQKLVLWGGGLADDLDKVQLLEKAKSLHLILAVGDRDPLITAEKMEEQTAYMKTLSLRMFSEFIYQGGHDLDESVLSQIVSGCRSTKSF